MAMRIREGECTNCRLCVEACPISGIEPPGDTVGRETYFIPPERCTECVGHYTSPRCETVCPLSCIEKDFEHPDTRAALIEKWRTLAPGRPFEMIPPKAWQPVDARCGYVR